MLKVGIESLLLFLTQKKYLPQTLIFFVTLRCNAGCEFCLYRSQMRNPTAAADELSVKEVEAIARKYKKLHYLALLGGEPFIRKDIDGIC